ncbi:MAG: hypothetical protein Q4E69_05665 [Bacilli bacterium]|nr:hypothetical protein [Bacilli bacterium]
MKDYIEIIDDEGNEETFELVSTFNIEGYSSNYVIYKNIDTDKLYLAKYNGMNISDLDTDLSDEERALAIKLFEGERL